MKTPPIVITLGGCPYSVRIGLGHLDRFYELMRAASLNQVTGSTPLLDDEIVMELWTMFNDSNSARRMFISLLFEHLTSVSGDDAHPTITPGSLITDMISALPDDRV